jgi:hypothetical protein
MTTTANKPWFKINKDVEYSTNYNFFKENQVFISKTGKNHSFCSRLEAKVFKKKIAVTKSGQIENVELENELRIIHGEILAGKHGEGKFVD